MIPVGVPEFFCCNDSSVAQHIAQGGFVERCEVVIDFQQALAGGGDHLHTFAIWLAVQRIAGVEIGAAPKVLSACLNSLRSSLSWLRMVAISKPEAVRK
jgi:hypothetical protein